MKGIVFNLLEEVVVREHGQDVWDDLLDATRLPGAFTSLGSYPDDHMGKLVMAAAKTLGRTPSEVLRWFGQEAMPALAERYPMFFTPHRSTRTFVLSLNNIIHPEVRKVYPGADAPSFDFEDTPDGGLLMGYQSVRRLCALAQGFVEGAGRHFGESVRCEHLKCMDRGDPKCVLLLHF